MLESDLQGGVQLLTKEKSALKALFLIILMVLCLGTIVFCCVPRKRFFPVPHIQSDNEQFLTLQQKYVRNMEHTIVHLLEPLVGRGKVRAVVQLDLNLKNAHLGQHTHTQNPQDANTSVSTDSSEKQIQNVIQKQHISVIVDGTSRKDDKSIYQPRTLQEMSTYRRLVQSAVGHDPNRGDTLEIQNMPLCRPYTAYNRNPY